MKRLLPAVFVLSGLLVACSSSDDGGAKGASSASSEPASCAEVKNPALLEAVHATTAQSVRAGTDGYFVAVAGGATWFTTSDPSKDDSGLVLPLNDAARSASDAGVDVPAGSPAYKGRSDGDPGARVVRSCV